MDEFWRERDLKRRELLVKASKLGLLGSAAAGIAILDGSRRAAASMHIKTSFGINHDTGEYFMWETNTDTGEKTTSRTFDESTATGWPGWPW